MRAAQTPLRGRLGITIARPARRSSEDRLGIKWNILKQCAFAAIKNFRRVGTGRNSVQNVFVQAAAAIGVCPESAWTAVRTIWAWGVPNAVPNVRTGTSGSIEAHATRFAKSKKTRNKMGTGAGYEEKNTMVVLCFLCAADVDERRAGIFV